MLSLFVELYSLIIHKACVTGLYQILIKLDIHFLLKFQALLRCQLV